MRTRTLSPILAALALAAVALATVPAVGAKTLELEVFVHELAKGGFHVVPDSITASVGDTLRLTVHNQGIEKDNIQHDLVVCGDGSEPPANCADIWGFTGMIPNNETRVLTAPMKRAGTFTYYCDLPGHAQAGMAGVLTVHGAGGTPAPTKASPGLALLGSLIALGAVALLRRTERS